MQKYYVCNAHGVAELENKFLLKLQIFAEILLLKESDIYIGAPHKKLLKRPLVIYFKFLTS